MSDFHALASTAGLLTQIQASGGTDSGVFIDVNLATNSVGLIIGLQESSDLGTFSPLTANPANLSIDGGNTIRYKLDISANPKFFRIDLKP